MQAQFGDPVFDLARQPARIVREILQRDHRRDVVDRLHDLVDVASCEFAHDVSPFLGMRERILRRWLRSAAAFSSDNSSSA